MLAYLKKLPYAAAAVTGLVAFPAVPAAPRALPARPAAAQTAPAAEGAFPETDDATPLPEDLDPSAEIRSAGEPGTFDEPMTFDQEAPPPEPAALDDELPVANTTCLTKTICAVKDRIRGQVPAWTPGQCRRIAEAVASSARRNDVSATLLLAIMISESDMNERSVTVYKRGGRVYAKDSGLMAIRCILNDRGRCTNGYVRGLAWNTLMDPVKNIELGARELARWRDGGGVMRATVVRRDEAGHLDRVTKNVPCRHKTHAYWAHYNHGPRYIDKGYPRHYAHRVAVIDHALATVMNVPAPELSAGRITVRDPGQRDRTPDRPVEPRFKQLTKDILASGSCSTIALN